MKTPSKKRAPVPQYTSPKQLTIEGFESPFDRKLNSSNRWVVLSRLLPWDEICELYWQEVPEKSTGRPALNPRIVVGSLIIKHICDLDDRETVAQISENIYMQYFLGYIKPGQFNRITDKSTLTIEFSVGSVREISSG